MERLTNRNIEIPSPRPENADYWRRVHLKLAEYEDAEEAGLLIRLPKNMSMIVSKSNAKSDILVKELIKSMRPYANDDRLFNAVDAIRVFIAHQNEFLDTFIREEAEAALAKEG